MPLSARRQGLNSPFIEDRLLPAQRRYQRNRQTGVLPFVLIYLPFQFVTLGSLTLISFVLSFLYKCIVFVEDVTQAGLLSCHFELFWFQFLSRDVGCMS